MWSMKVTRSMAAVRVGVGQHVDGPENSKGLVTNYGEGELQNGRGM